MIRFVLGVFLLLLAVIVPLIMAGEVKRVFRGMLGGTLAFLGAIFIIFSTSLYVGDDESGLLIKKFGSSLPEGKIIAVNGERGVQADILSPGWSFGWLPWLYDKTAVKATLIPDGQIGIVTAIDGASLPDGEVYGQAWRSTDEMLDARTFLTKGGTKGPQLTVLPPGMYRFNARLYTVTVAPATDIKIGFGAVVRANAGRSATSNEITVVNGTQLVPPGSKGFWNKALPPGQYYMHPAAYEIITAKTSKRMYSYTSAKGAEANTSSAKEPDGDNSVLVRTKDGYKIPCDVRVGVSIGLADLPQLIARIPEPDKDDDKDGFDNLEEKAILPAVRALLRNTSETQDALAYVASRSKVESETKLAFTAAMKQNQITVEEFYLADINIDSTPEGQQLLKTQTDAKLASEQQKMYAAQVESETKRGEQVKAMATADMQKKIQESLASIEVEKNNAEAMKLTNEGKATESLIYEAKVKAMGGTDAMTRLEVMRMLIEAAPKLGEAVKGIKLPDVFVSGGGNGQDGADTSTALLATLIKTFQDAAVSAPVKK